MKTEAANRARAEQAERRRQFCLNNRSMRAKTLASMLNISVRQVRRYLAPYAEYKHRKYWERQQTQRLIESGKTREQIRDMLPITERQYYYYKSLKK